MKQKRILKISSSLTRHSLRAARPHGTCFDHHLQDIEADAEHATRDREDSRDTRKEEYHRQEKQTRTKETKVTTFDRKKKKVLPRRVASSSESALAKVIANKKSVTSEKL